MISNLHVIFFRLFCNILYVTNFFSIINWRIISVETFVDKDNMWFTLAGFRPVLVGDATPGTRQFLGPGWSNTRDEKARERLDLKVIQD